MNAKPQIWNDVTIPLLKSMLAEDKSFREIALAIGVSRNAIAGAARRYHGGGGKVPSASWTDEERTTLRSLVNQRQTVRQICTQMNKGRSAIEKQLRRLGLKAKRGDFTIGGPGKAATRLTREQLEPATPAPFLSVSFYDLQRHQCRYPHGENVLLFCGQPRDGESSYCAFHLDFCYERRGSNGLRYTRPAQTNRSATVAATPSDAGSGIYITQPELPFGCPADDQEPVGVDRLLDMAAELQGGNAQECGTRPEGVGGLGDWQQIGEIASAIAGRMSPVDAPG